MSSSSNAGPITRHAACGFHLGAVLGAGATATVYLGVRDSDSTATAAVKLVDKLRVPPATRKTLAQEVVVMRQVIHPAVLPLIAAAENESHIAIATKYCAEGDLLDLLNQKRGLPERQAAQMFERLCGALSAAHLMRWAHRDLKPENVLISNGEVYLADWGSAVHFAHDQVQRCIDFAGTDGYAAPEIRDARTYNPFAADVWSFGASLYVVCAAGFPFLQDEKRHCRGPLVIPSRFSPQLHELLRGCLAPAAARWTIDQVRNCSWFAAYRSTPTEGGPKIPRVLSRSQTLIRSPTLVGEAAVPRSPKMRVLCPATQQMDDLSLS